MYFRSFFDENLAQMSYLVGCQQTGEAIVIDPARHIEVYIEAAQQEELRVIAAAETHIHADFLSGARELAKKHDIKLYLSGETGEEWAYQFIDELDHQLLYDGDSFQIGKVDFNIMHTPGHTPESLSYVLTDEGAGASEPMGIFTGDFVFVGDIGRPDLLEKAAGDAGTAKTGAIQMYHSLKKFHELQDHLQVWPGHGAGSACGKSLGAVPMSTVGYEKMVNWALQETDEETFVRTLLSGQPEPPKYFGKMKKLNKEGPPLLDHKPVHKLESTSELDAYKENSVIVDTRQGPDFAHDHYKGSINIAFTQSFTNWAGWLIDYGLDIILGISAENIDVVKKNLESIGLDNVVAFIEPADLIRDSAQTESYREIDVHELHEDLKEDAYYVIDVRNQDEWDEGRIPGTHHKMLGTLPDRLDELPDGKTYIVHCRTGKRSAIAASILQANGLKNVLNVKGGYQAWATENYPIKREKIEV